MGRGHLACGDRAAGDGCGLPQSRSTGRHGTHRRPHQWWPADSGVGAGWYERDYTTYGYDFGTTGSRFDLFEDSLVRIESRLGQLLPQPVRPIPILIGGGGEKRTIPLVARHAHIWHAFGDIDTYRRKNSILIAEADRIGRDHNEIERSTSWGWILSAGSPRQRRTPTSRWGRGCSPSASTPTTVMTCQCSTRRWPGVTHAPNGRGCTR